LIPQEPTEKIIILESKPSPKSGAKVTVFIIIPIEGELPNGIKRFFFGPIVSNFFRPQKGSFSQGSSKFFQLGEGLERHSSKNTIVWRSDGKAPWKEHLEGWTILKGANSFAKALLQEAEKAFQPREEQVA
jgi:hypothetical protein